MHVLIRCRDENSEIAQARDVEHSGHFGHIEEPEEFASAVAGFVERNVAAG